MDTTPASGQAPVTTAPGKGNRWFVMRDLSRSNAKVPAWEMLRDKHIRHFTPLVWRMMSVGGKRKPRQVPYIQDLVFAYGTRGELDPLVERVRTFQYRYLRHTWREPMTVPDLEMERFIPTRAPWSLSAAPSANASSWRYPCCWPRPWRWSRNTSNCCN